MTRQREQPALRLPEHWSPEQALAVFECLQALREALWAAYGTRAQQAWCDQLGERDEQRQREKSVRAASPQSCGLQLAAVLSPL